MMKAVVLFLLASLCCGLATDCGRRNTPLGNIRISGGTDALPHEFPWHVALKSRGSYVCGGSIINEQWIVTAAHCVIYKKSGYTVLAGKHNMKQKEIGEQIRNVSKIRIHPLSWAARIPYDVALLKLSSPLNFTKNRHIGPVCLPKKDLLNPGTLCTATGWGATGQPGSKRWRLQKIDMPILSPKECYAEFKPKGLLKEAAFCAGKNGGNGICSGDSGGPLVCQRKNNRWFLAGISSKGWKNCGRYKSTGLFTNVTTVLSWITVQMGHDDVGA